MGKRTCWGVGEEEEKAIEEVFTMHYSYDGNCQKTEEKDWKVFVLSVDGW